MEGFPKLSIARAQAFRDWLRSMNAFNTAVTAIRLENKVEARRQQAQELVARLTDAGAQLPLTVAYELVKVVRDLVGWKEVDDLIERLPKGMQELPLFVEQRALARSKAGDHAVAIAALLELIEMSGDSDERCGLIGGRYKRLWRETRDADQELAAEHLDSAIEYYERGRLCDLNTYYSASNLPLLLRVRARARRRRACRSHRGLCRGRLRARYRVEELRRMGLPDSVGSGLPYRRDGKGPGASPESPAEPSALEARYCPCRI